MPDMMVDHYTKTFIVKVRSMNNVGPETIKDLIEQKHEVVEIEEDGGSVIGLNLKD